jgi:hypothetical protein
MSLTNEIKENIEIKEGSKRLRGRPHKEGERKTENIRAYMLEYYKNKKEQLLKNQSKKIICSCGMLITYSSKNKHLNNKYHLLKMELLNLKNNNNNVIIN